MDEKTEARPHLHSGWVIANHILVSFHVAFISSLLSIPAHLQGTKVLGFVFASPETIISALFWLATFHTGIAVHEMGHFLKAMKVNALSEALLPDAQKRMTGGLFNRLSWYLKMFLLIPYGRFRGVKNEGLTYYPDAPFNLSVAAAGPRASRTLALVMLPPALALLVIGLLAQYHVLVYVGRLCLGIGFVGLLDFLFADPGKYKEYRERETQAAQRAGAVEASPDAWINRVAGVKTMMREKRMREIRLPDGEIVRAPWQFRNCGMGGRHTEKEYPESNISLQELMFAPLCARDYEEAQMITITLQNRLKEIIEKEAGARVMGIGLEGGLAPFIAKEPADAVPEERAWRMAIQAITDSGYVPGKDVAIAYDFASSELSNAYREEFKQAEAVGMYYFWRSQEKTLMSREQMLNLCKSSLARTPVVVFEDAFAEDDHEGWRLLMQELGDKVFIIGDDLVTTKDTTIEECADKKLINTALIKANQIGTLSETMLAMLVALGKKLDIVVSHRSKSPNDDMEAQIALSVNALGLKTGGGANTERLFKYGAVTKIMKDIERSAQRQFGSRDATRVSEFVSDLVITDIVAYEEPTNAGIPTVGVEIHVGIPDNREYRKIMKFTGSTPLGTSAGSGEAIHLIDSVIESSPVVARHRSLFAEQPDKTFVFKKGVDTQQVEKTDDRELIALWQQTQRYGGKGCQNAVRNVTDVIAPLFVGARVATLKSIVDVDRRLLQLEKETAVKRGKIPAGAGEPEIIDTMQRKGNLGMNAILSVSLALGRLIAQMQGKDLWQLLREEMETAMAKTIVTEGGIETVRALAPAVAAKNASWSALREALVLEDLVRGLQQIEEILTTRQARLHEALRKQIPVYQ